MATIDHLIKEKREEILRLALRYGAYNLRLFGSVARGEAAATSDVDLLVSMEKGHSYLDLVGFWQDVEELLHCKVDVVTDGGISPYLKDKIYAEAKPL